MGLTKAMAEVGIGLVHSFWGKLTGHKKSEKIDTDTDADKAANSNIKDNQGAKKRRVEDEFITPVKQSQSLRQELVQLPRINESKLDIKFAKSPIEWDMNNMTKDNGSNDYGTSFIKSKKKSYRSNTMAQHLRSVYKGQFNPSPLRTQSPSPVIEQADQKVTQRISSLTKLIGGFFKDNAKSRVSTRRVDDDVIFVKEVKLPPTTSRFSLKFNLDDLSFPNDFSTYQRLLNERREQSEKIHREVLKASKPKSKIIRELSKEEEDEVINIWKSKDKDSKILAQLFDIEVRVRDLKSLADARWLNDVVIDVFLKIISTERVHTFSTFFFTNLETKGYKGVQKWMKRAKKDISKLDLILCPINVHQTHWVTGAIDLKNKKILYMDSLAGHETSHGAMALGLLMEFLEGETKKQGNPGLCEGFESLQIIDCPQQRNGYDCGVFTLLNSLHLSKGAQLEYDPNEAKSFRRVVANMILHGNST
jgi:sentrin-specific protease 1